jgi:hypothetical protein
MKFKFPTVCIVLLSSTLLGLASTAHAAKIPLIKPSIQLSTTSFSVLTPTSTPTQESSSTSTVVETATTRPTKEQPPQTASTTAPDVSSKPSPIETSQDSTAVTHTPSTPRTTTKHKESSNHSKPEAASTAIATTSAAATSTSTTTVSTTPLLPFLSGTKNVGTAYGYSGSFTPEQTRNLLEFAFALGLFGFLLAEHNILMNTSAWIARLFVKRRQSRFQSRSSI